MKKMKTEVKIEKRSMILALIVLLLILLLPSNILPVLADSPHWGYSNETDIMPHNPDWMAKLSDNLNLTMLSIPGTHETMTYDAFDYWTKCQSTNLWNQLNAGIRALDIRIRQERVPTLSAKFSIWHSFMPQNKDFKDVLGDCTEFLNKHPNETILMRLSTSGCPHPLGVPDRPFIKTFEWYLNEPAAGQKKYNRDYIWGYKEEWFGSTKQPSIPKLGDVRGKIIILQQEEGECKDFTAPHCEETHVEWGGKYYGLPYKDGNGIFDIQEHWNLYGKEYDGDNANELINKWKKIKTQLEEANDARNYNTIYVNCLSGAADPLQSPFSLSPFMVASGHEWNRPDTEHYIFKFLWWEEDVSHMRKAFSDISPNLRGYLNGFPREGDNDETVVLDGTNEMCYKYLMGYVEKVKTERCGIIMADFPGHALIENIIKLNPNFHPDANGPYVGNEGSEIVFDASASKDPDGDTLRYMWNLDGGYWDTNKSTDSKVSRTFTDDYNGTVILWVEDDKNHVLVTTKVTVYNVAPTVEAGTNRTVNKGDTVNFSGNFIDPGNDTHDIEWNFGDGSKATGTLTPTHTYGEDGVYPVTLTVTDDNRGVGTDTLTVTVEPGPVICCFDVNYEEETYVVETCSNSSVTNLTFDVDLMRLRFNVNGTDGTSGFCNISIPAELISGDFTVFMDDTQLVEGADYTLTFNGTHHMLNIKYDHSTHIIDVIGTSVIPDFAEWLFLPLAMAATLLALALRKKLKKQKKFY